MDNQQFIKLMFIGIFVGILLGNLLHYLVESLKNDEKEIMKMNEDRVKKNFRTIQEFNYSNTVSVKINHELKKELREIYKRFGFNKEACNELELKYDNESYKIVAELQQGIFKKVSTIDIANKIFEILQKGDGMVIFPEEIKKIIDINLEKRNG